MFYNLLEESAASSETGSSSTLGTVFIIVIILAFVVLLIWQNASNKKKQQQTQKTIDALKIGDRVKTIGGVCGFVAEIRSEDNTFVLETGTDANKCYVRFDKGAIYQTAPADGNDGTVVAQTEVKEEAKAEIKEEVKEEAPASKVEKKQKKNREEF